MARLRSSWNFLSSSETDGVGVGALPVAALVEFVRLGFLRMFSPASMELPPPEVFDEAPTPALDCADKAAALCPSASEACISCKAALRPKPTFRPFFFFLRDFPAVIGARPMVPIAGVVDARDEEVPAEATGVFLLLAVVEAVPAVVTGR